MVPMTAIARPYPRPTAQVEPYVRALGTELAMRFILTFGGSSTYIPVKAEEGSEVTALVGPEGTRALAAIRDRLPARVPLAKGWLVQCLLAEGKTVNEIARTLRASDTGVRNMIRRWDAREAELRQRQAGKT
jgi:hypothetical protein